MTPACARLLTGLKRHAGRCVVRGKPTVAMGLQSHGGHRVTRGDEEAFGSRGQLLDPALTRPGLPGEKGGRMRRALSPEFKGETLDDFLLD